MSGLISVSPAQNCVVEFSGMVQYSSIALTHWFCLVSSIMLLVISVTGEESVSYCRILTFVSAYSNMVQIITISEDNWQSVIFPLVEHPI